MNAALRKAATNAANYIRRNGFGHDQEERIAEIEAALAEPGNPLEEAIRQTQRDIAPAEAKGPAPAMPNGVEAARVLADFAETAPGRLPGRVQDAIATVRAADNRDVAGAEPGYCAIHQSYKWCEHNGGIGDGRG